MAKLNVADAAPDFVLPTPNGEVSLSGALARAERGVIVYFYPRAMTPGCTAQACDFRDSLGSLRGAGYEVVGVSPDGVGRLAEFARRDGLAFPLASDPSHEVMRAYGAYGEKKNYGRLVEGVIRSTVVVGTDGRVAHALYNVKAKGHVARLRRELGLG